MRVGLQKLTLLDYPGVMACTVFTAGCNFRCPFCHNGSIATGNQEEMPMDSGELFSYLESRRKILDGVCITGGEPLLHRATPDMIRRIKDLGFLVKLDTNGSFPDRLQEVISGGCVDYVAMDIKNSPEKYAGTSGCAAALEQVEKSIAILRSSPVEFEFRTTVVTPLHTPEDLESIAKWISGVRHYYIQNYVDSGDILEKNNNFSPVAPEILDEMLARVKTHIPGAVIRGK